MGQIAAVLFTLLLFLSPAMCQTPDASLTADQKKLLKLARVDLDGRLVPTVLKLTKLMKDYDRNILAEAPDAEFDAKLESEIAQVLAGVITEAVHLRAQSIHSVAKVLTPEQKKLLLEELNKPDSKPGLIELVDKVFGKK